MCGCLCVCVGFLMFGCFDNICTCMYSVFVLFRNPLTPNDDYNVRTSPLTSKSCLLYIYSTNIGTEYFKHGVYSPFISSSKCSLFHYSNLFCSWIIHILYTGCVKIKKIIPTPKCCILIIICY